VDRREGDSLTTRFGEEVTDNFQRSTRLIPDSRSCILLYFDRLVSLLASLKEGNRVNYAYI
jgi:hypothetical protein